MANSIQPSTENDRQLLGCLVNIYTLNSVKAECSFSAQLFEALRIVKNQHVDPSPVSPGADFEKCIIYKLLCMVS